MDILLKERLVSYYEKHILEDVMPFWDRRCIDKEYGGYITCFDREGKMIFGFKGVSYIYIHCFITKYAKRRSGWKMQSMVFHFL